MRHVHAHFIDQSQRPHRHAEMEHRLVYVSRARSGFKQMSCLNQIRHQNPIHQKAGTVLHDDRQLADLLHKTQRAFRHFRTGLPPDDHFDQLHPVDRVEEMDAHDALRRLRARGNFGDRQGGRVGGQNRVRPRPLSEPLENLLLQFHFLHRRFNDQINMVQRHFSRARENAVQTCAGFDLCQQVPFHALVVELSDASHSLGHLLRVDVA